ncbi:MAG: LPS export ABC transporter periplasmic protein LptC, partial [Bacteroidales bacterium]|nr:LPS export ABC transporter periplasmic protein LptC [Bacteroidales bacterium]
ADTAYNYETKQLWHLIKNVEVHSVQGEYFRSNDLFWDLRQHEVYTDSFIHIERPDATIEGYGFKSNDAFTKYEIRQTSGIFPFRDDMEKKPKVEVDTLQESGAIAEDLEEINNQ